MTDITEYMQGKDKLENREEFLSKLIEDLDSESKALFDEIVDLGNISYYNVTNLYYRVQNLRKLFLKMTESYQYLGKIELSSYDYAGKRFQLKRLLTATTTVYAFMANALLGIIAFVLLNQKATNDFYRDLMDINERTSVFDEEQVKKIGLTLENCIRLLEGKIKKMNEDGNLYNTVSNISLPITQANALILSYIEGYIDEETINGINSEVKSIIIDILKNDLNSDSDDIIELLNKAKNRNNNGMKLMKEYK